MSISVLVWGATGYAGQELLRLLGGHPEVRIQAALSRRPEEEYFHAAHPAHGAAPETPPVPWRPADLSHDLSGVDVVFCALPHGSSAPVVEKSLQAGCRVIDLGSDFRLRDREDYPRWYGREHPAPHLLEEAFYGLAEWTELLNGRPLEEARLVAVPGCYPTGALLALLPLLRAGAVDPEGLVVDSKSGASGAGRFPGDDLTFSEVHENVRPYKLAAHRHTPEIEQALSTAAGRPVRVTFAPHLVPMARGILSTCHAVLRPSVEAGDIDAAFSEAYRQTPFVRRAPGARQPETKWVRGSNTVYLQWTVDERTGRLIVTSAIDNLVKGAAGQAVQCMNRMFEIEETLGLRLGGLVP